MCTLYPRYGSCCGIPTRIALIFIAILSMVTGAIINAALKKAGVDVSSIQDVKLLKNITKKDFHFEDSRINDTVLPLRHREVLEVYEDVKRTTRKVRRTRSRRTTTTEPEYTTVEIIGEDGHTEILRFQNEPESFESGETTHQVPSSATTAAPQTTTTGTAAETTTAGSDTTTAGSDTTSAEPGTTAAPPATQATGSAEHHETESHEHHETESHEDQGSTTEHHDPGLPEEQSSTTEHHDTESSTLDSAENWDTPSNTTEEHDVTTPSTSPKTTESWEEKVKKKDPLARTMGYVNRNGLNFLSTMFVALGILLLVGNFLNSPDIVLLYVVALIVTDIAALVLLTSVVTECTRAPGVCLLSHMDWFSGFMVTVFWFLYIFIWAFFAAVANAYANGGVGNTLAP